MTDEEIFAHANQLAGGELNDYLNQCCAGDAAQRQRIEALLAAHGRHDSLFEAVVSSDASLARTTDTVAAGRHPVIGNYKLLHKLGEGGFGVVYMAEQLRPVRRKVALKIVKAERMSDATATVARFEAERQALAMMDHPNIATVFDGGSIPAGSSLPDAALGSVERPFFVMELVNGVPITEYCDKNHLPTRERLELFITVCQAVQHAHQKGVIHRDIKPSNILVTLHDGSPVVKVIDFGVAKAINQQLTEKTLYTVLGDMIGTPQYMSPEQAERSGLDIDTRSDVYSLGVLLYELLTGGTPLTCDDLREAGLLKIQQRIIDSDPPKPSTRLSTSGDQLTVIAKHRSVSPERLSRELKGDLDWIVMKALEKDRTRRYESASRFADDIRRFLNDDLIEARAPSTWYLTRKLWRRNKPMVIGVSTVFAALLVGLLVAGWQYLEKSATAERLERTVAEYEKGQVELTKHKQELTAQEVKLTKQEEKLAKQEEKLTKQELELAATAKKLRDELIHKGLMAALNLNKEGTEAAISQLQLSDGNEAWVHMLRGELALYGENPQDAISHLDQAFAVDPSNLTARAMRVGALFFNGDVREAGEEMERLKDSSPTSEFEKLFVGQTLAMSQHREPNQQAAKLIDESLRGRPSPLAFAIQAQVTGHLALDSHDEQLARQAMRKIIAAKEYLPDNPFVRMIYVSVHHTANNLALIDNSEFLAILNEQADFGRYAIGHFVCGMGYEDLGMDQEAEHAYRLASRDGDWWVGYSGILLARGEFEDVHLFIEEHNNRFPEDKDLQFRRQIMPRLADIVEGRFEKAALIELARDPATSAMVLGDIAFLLLEAGEFDVARELATRPGLPGYSRLALEYLPQSLTIDEVHKKYPDSRLQQGLVLFTLGMVQLGKRNREPAKEYFQACIDTRDFFATGYYESKMLLKLIDQGRLPVASEE